MENTFNLFYKFDNILDKLDGFDGVILRMDVEGSEYRLIPILLKHKNIVKIKEFYMEWHTKNNEHIDIDVYNKELIKKIPLTLIAVNDRNSQFKMLTTHKS